MDDYTGFLGQHDSRVKDVLKWAVVIRMPANLSVRVLARGRADQGAKERWCAN